MYKYDFSGDPYVDYALSYWFDWWNKTNKTDYDLSEEQADEMFLEYGFDKLVEIIFEEFPIIADTKNCDFDAEYCWDIFRNTKEGKKAEKYMDEVVSRPVIDTSIVNEYLDYNFIAESFEAYEENAMKNYLYKNEKAKTIPLNDRKNIILAFKKGVLTELSNGFSFLPSEYAECVVAENDDIGTTEADITKMMNGRDKYLKRGNLYIHAELYNPRLYSGTIINFIYEIHLGRLVNDILDK